MTAETRLPTHEEVWRRYDDDEQRLTAPLSERMLDLAELRPGMRVLDLATGRGEPALRAAHRVGPKGQVFGVDIAESMLAMARERAEREGLSNVELRVMSAEALDGVPSGAFDVTLARWGLMYLDDPVRALGEARRAMIPGGRLVAALWAEAERVSYFTLPRRVLEKYRELPPDPRSAATFRYAKPADIDRDFEAAGLRISHIEEQWIPVMEAKTGAELVAWTRAFGLTRLMQGLPEEVQRAWEGDLVREAEPLREAGFVRLGGVTRIVVATSSEPPR